jgi:ankyrin repeat protein
VSPRKAGSSPAFLFSGLFFKATWAGIGERLGKDSPMLLRFASIALSMLLAHSAFADELPLPHQQCASEWTTVVRKGYLLGAMNATPEIARLLVNAGDGKLDDVRKQLHAMPPSDAKQWRQAAMITAAWTGQSHEIDVLLGDGADVDATAQIPNFGKAVVGQMQALNPQLFKAAANAGLLDQGELRTSGPALVIAIECGDAATVEVLLRHQANAKLRPGGGGADVLLWATVHGDATIVRNLLDHGADVCEDDRRERQLRHEYNTKHPGHENARPLFTYTELGRRAKLPDDVVARLTCPAYDAASASRP